VNLFIYHSVVATQEAKFNFKKKNGESFCKDFIWCYGIVFSLVELNSGEFFSNFVTHRHAYKLYSNFKLTNIRVIFSQRVIGFGTDYL